MPMSQYTIPQFIVDAFTDTVFKGNPAAVCLLDEWLPDDTLQNIAKENNLSEADFRGIEIKSQRLFNSFYS